MELGEARLVAVPRLMGPLSDWLRGSPVGSRFASGAFWSVIAAVIPRGIMLVATMVVARLLGKTVYGELGMIQSTVNMLGAFAGFGLGLTATKHVAEFRKTDPTRAGRILGLSGWIAVFSGGLMAGSLLAFAPWLADHAINAPHLGRPLRIGAIILFISALNGAQVGALSGFEAFKKIAFVNTFVGLLSFPMLIAGAYWAGLEGALWALAFNFGVTWVCNHVALRREAARYNVPLLFTDCRQEWPVLWRFSLPAVLGGALPGLAYWGCGALLVNQPGGYGEMGIFSAVNHWFVLLIFIPGVLGAVILPILSDQLGQGEVTQSKKTLIFAIKANLLAVAPVAILGAVASPYIMGLYGSTFRGGWPTLAIMSLTAILFAAVSAVGQIIAASGRMWVGFTMNIGWTLVLLSGAVLLVEYGAAGLAGAIAIAYVFHTLWVSLFANSLLKRQG